MGSYLSSQPPLFCTFFLMILKLFEYYLLERHLATLEADDRVYAQLLFNICVVVKRVYD